MLSFWPSKETTALCKDSSLAFFHMSQGPLVFFPRWQLGHFDGGSWFSCSRRLLFYQLTHD